MNRAQNHTISRSGPRLLTTERNLSSSIETRSIQVLLAKSPLEQDCDPYLKFVQASVIGAHGLTIRGNSEFEIWGWKGSTLKKLEQRLLYFFKEYQDDSAGCLAMGLAALRLKHDLIVECFSAGETIGERLLLGPGASNFDLTEAIRSEEQVVWQKVLRIKLLIPSLSIIDLKLIVKKRCPLARVHFLSDDSHSPRIRSHHTLSALRQQYSSKSKIPNQAIPMQANGSWLLSEKHRHFRHTKVKLLKRGVIIEELCYPKFLGHSVIVCVDHLQTDITGLKLIKNESYRRTIEEILSLLSVTVAESSASPHPYRYAYTNNIIFALFALTIVLLVQLNPTRPDSGSHTL